MCHERIRGTRWQKLVWVFTVTLHKTLSLSKSKTITKIPMLVIRAAGGTRPGYPTGTRVINYLGNFLLPAATRVPEQKQITANVLNISAIFNRIYGIRISIYRILTHHQWILWQWVTFSVFFRPILLSFLTYQYACCTSHLPGLLRLHFFFHRPRSIGGGYQGLGGG